MKKKIIIISTLSILIIGIVVTLIIVNSKPETKLDNNQSSTDVEENKSDKNNQVTNTDKDEKNEEKDLEENKTENKQEESNKNNNDVMQDTKKEETKKNNSTNNISNNNQPTQPTSTPEQPKETTPVVTETKYYAQCSLGSLESGKKLTASQIKAKYPVGESNTQGQSVLHSDLDKIAPQTGLSRDAFDAYQGACKWVSTDNKETLGYTMVVYIAVLRNFDKWQTINTELYNKYLNAWNSLTYYNWDSNHRIIGEYYLNNHQWKWNPNGFHF